MIKQKYLSIDQEFLEYHVESDDGKFNKTFLIPKTVVEDLQLANDVLDDYYSDYADSSLNAIVVYGLIAMIVCIKNDDNLKEMFDEKVE